MILQPTEADDRDEKESGNEAATGLLFFIVPSQKVELCYLGVESGMLKFNITIHKQVMDLLEDSGTKGMTLNVRTIQHNRSPLNALTMNRNSLRPSVNSTNALLSYCSLGQKSYLLLHISVISARPD